MASGAIKLWVITEGIAGTENQCLGIAGFLHAATEVKRIALRQPWKTLSPYLGFEMAETFMPPFQGEWPKIVIASGRKAIAACNYIKAHSPTTKIIFVQNPRWNLKNFDLVVAPAHDDLHGANVLHTVATPNRIRASLLESECDKWTALAQLNAPRAAVLIGGSTKKYTITQDDIEKLKADLKSIAQTHSLMITASRRTGDENITALRSFVEGLSGTHYFWDGTGENPYFGLLAYADYIFATGDSLSMLSEAATTGKPVYRLLYGKPHKRLEKAHENLEKTGSVRLYKGTIETAWDYTPLNDAANIAAEIKRRFLQ
ncbi:MAG: hypothetical protein GC136_07365 [Alphaproteobacteria bacterium]|nr:hypothetical protein [Alphaproteobacteria bacterium]